MKRFLLVLILFTLSTNSAFCMIDAATGEEIKGYRGELPDVTERFQKFVKKTARPQFKSIDAFNVSRGYKPVPRDNPAYVNVIIKKERKSDFANDINNLIPIVEKLISSIENGENEQLFAARANFMYDNVEYVRKKYAERDERYYPAYDALITSSNRARTVVNIRNEAKAYSVYLPYQTEGYMYTPQYLDAQLKNLYQELTNTIILMRDVD
ncbi:MAG: hypothetical protein ACI4SM_02210 [Candidatus Gastranaerophilaceae bacterium]